MKKVTFCFFEHDNDYIIEISAMDISIEMVADTIGVNVYFDGNNIEQITGDTFLILSRDFYKDRWYIKFTVEPWGISIG